MNVSVGNEVREKVKALEIKATIAAQPSPDGALECSCWPDPIRARMLPCWALPFVARAESLLGLSWPSVECREPFQSALPSVPFRDPLLLLISKGLPRTNTPDLTTCIAVGAQPLPTPLLIILSSYAVACCSGRCHWCASVLPPLLLVACSACVCL